MKAKHIPDLPEVVIPGYEVPAISKRILVDYCALTFRHVEHEELIQQVELAMNSEGEPWKLFRRGQLGYENTIRGPEGAKIFWSEGRRDIHLELRGKACARVGGERMRPFLRWARQEVMATATRIDLTLDDLARRVRPIFVASEFYSERCVTRAAELDCDWRMKRNGTLRKELIHIGGITSDRYLKVYDKYLKDSKNPAIRWELTYKDDLATLLLDELVSREDWGAVFAEHLKGYIDFLEPGPKPRQPCAWYYEFVGDAAAAKVSTPVQPSSLVDLSIRLRHQHSPSLAVLFEAKGRDKDAFIEELDLEGGKRRWKPKHLKMLEDHRRIMLLDNGQQDTD